MIKKFVNALNSLKTFIKSFDLQNNILKRGNFFFKKKKVFLLQGCKPELSNLVGGIGAVRHFTILNNELKLNNRVFSLKHIYYYDLSKDKSPLFIYKGSLTKVGRFNDTTMPFVKKISTFLSLDTEALCKLYGILCSCERSTLDDIIYTD